MLLDAARGFHLVLLELLHLLTLVSLQLDVVIDELAQVGRFLDQALAFFNLLLDLLLGALHIFLILLALVLESVRLPLLHLELLADALELYQQLVVHVLQNFFLLSLALFEFVELNLELLHLIVVSNLALLELDELLPSLFQILLQVAQPGLLCILGIHVEALAE